MEMKKIVNINSSNINKVGYFENKSSLFIKFNDGSSYEYYDVSLSIREELFNLINNGISAGKSFNRLIKNNYNYDKKIVDWTS